MVVPGSRFSREGVDAPGRRWSFRSLRHLVTRYLQSGCVARRANWPDFSSHASERVANQPNCGIQRLLWVGIIATPNEGPSQRRLAVKTLTISIPKLTIELKRRCDFLVDVGSRIKTIAAADEWRSTMFYRLVNLYAKILRHRIDKRERRRSAFARRVSRPRLPF
jgi:hypothetical protein